MTRKISLSKLAEQDTENNIAAHSLNHILYNYAKYVLEVLLFDIENFLLKVFADLYTSAEKRRRVETFLFFSSVQFILF
jgi:hypothetical protein